MAKSNVGKIIFAAIALIVAALSLVLVIIYATLAVDVIGYMSLLEKNGADGLGAAVGLIVMIVVGAGVLGLALIGAILFAVSRRMAGRVRTLAAATFVYHVLAVLLAIITFIVVKILS